MGEPLKYRTDFDKHVVTCNFELPLELLVLPLDTTTTGTSSGRA